MHSFNNDTYLSIKSLGSNWMFSLIVLTNCLIVLDKDCNFCDSTHYISQSSIWFVGAFNRETKEMPMTVCLDCFYFYIFYLLCATTFISEYIVGFITDPQDLTNVRVSLVALRIKSSKHLNLHGPNTHVKAVFCFKRYTHDTMKTFWFCLYHKASLSKAILRHWSMWLVSSGVSVASLGEGPSLALVAHPSSDVSQ